MHSALVAKRYKSISQSLNPGSQAVPFIKRILFILIGAYLVVGPVSVSGAVSIDNNLAYLKWVRVGILCLCGFVSMRWLSLPGPHRAGFWLLLFALIFWISGIWSSNPIWALAYKGLFFGSILAGVSMARAVSSQRDLLALCRTLAVASILGIIGIILIIAASWPDDTIFRHGRFAIAGINANALAQTASILAVLMFFHGATERSSRWRGVTMLCFVVLLAIVILTGSRGGTAMVVIGIGTLIPVLSNRYRKRAVGILVTCAIAVFGGFILGSELPAAQSDLFLYDLSDSSKVDGFEFRLWQEGLKDTRSGIWRHALRMFFNDPLVGRGWYSSGSRWATVQSSYLQVLVEAGLTGAFFVSVMLWKTFSQIPRAIQEARRAHDELAPLTYISATLAAALLLHGVFESSAFVGSTPNSLLIGFTVCHLDLRLDWARQKRRARNRSTIESGGHGKQ